MTPQEALAQALLGVANSEAFSAFAVYMLGEYGAQPGGDDPAPLAAAILDALRALDADIITKSDHSTGMRLWTTAWEQGAQQERDRLWEAVKPLFDMLPGGYGRDERFATMWDAFHPEDDHD